MSGNNKRAALLKQSRSSLQNKLTAFLEFLNSEQLDLDEVDLRFERIKNSFENFDKVHDELVVLKPGENHDEIKDQIENDYFKAAPQVRKLLKNNPNSSNITSMNETAGHSGTARPKLPKPDLPKFSGNYEDWPSFRNFFEVLIHNRNDISDFEKLTYLSSTLTGDARKKIDLTDITENSYESTWQSLIDFYDNKRLIISRRLDSLLSLKKIENEDIEKLRALADQAVQHVKSLENLGIKNCSEITVKIIERCLPESLAFKWDETLTKDEYPEFEKIIEFINNTVARLATRSTSIKQFIKRSIENDTSSNKRRKFEERPKRHTFVTQTFNDCDVCKDGQHPLFKCPEFRKTHVSQRFKYVREKNLCKNCLRSHEGEKCTWSGCIVCNNDHNTLLHFSNFNSNKKTQKPKEASNKQS